ncbi:hypothetical protein [Capillimicrobium parvum]|uniref:Uncharacterized protein n=1 Tax=Capillimicrobium parvum TaxID=2884022 RepID=A0A9E7BYY2_9ACTN|nr:hypothetical protein [Capillimicrobium parvum]UGS34756.1 hypothetical protein DSM104329_01138 [Capillimicrobium parvum]
MPDSDLWRVYLAVPAEHVDAIRDGAPKVVPADRHSVLTDDRYDGMDAATELAVDVAAATHEEALEAARRIYVKVAIAGGVDYREVAADDVGVIGFHDPGVRDPVIALVAEAKALLDRGCHDWAIVRATTACELCAKAALRSIFHARFDEERAEAAERACRDLNDKRHRDVLFAATGSTPTTETWWEEYAALIERRNAVVHEGLSVMPEHAARSVDAAEQFVAWLHRLRTGLDLGD